MLINYKINLEGCVLCPMLRMSKLTEYIMLNSGRIFILSRYETNMLSDIVSY